MKYKAYNFGCGFLKRDMFICKLRYNPEKL